jgi:hypothetical protein
MQQNFAYQWSKCYQPMVAQGNTRGNILVLIHTVTAKATLCYLNEVTQKIPSLDSLCRVLPLLPQIDTYPYPQKDSEVSTCL